MSSRHHCDVCAADFVAEPTPEGRAPRCPTCLRKSSVRRVSDDDGEVEQLARGHATRAAGARAGTLIIAITLSCALGAAVLTGWSVFTRFDLGAPMVAAWIVATIAWARAGLLGGTRAFVLRALGGLGAGVWALVSGTVAVAAGDDLSPVFTAAIALVLFGGGLIGVLQWMQRREEPPPTAGKWR